MTKVDTSKASSAFDAWIGKNVLGLDVVGEARCRNYGGAGWAIAPGWPALQRARYPVRPVHVAHCACDLDGLDDVPMFGHFYGCLEVVEWYTTDIAAAWEVVEHMTNFFPLYFTMVKGARECNGYGVGFSETPSGRKPWFGYSKSAPLAICRAAYAALTKGDIDN